MKIISQTLKKIGLKTIIRTILIVGFFSFLVVYAILKTRAIATGINLRVEGIENGAVYHEATLEIRGNAHLTRHLLINGKEQSISQEGDFTDTLVLSPGYNIITVSAEDRFGKITKEVFEVIRKDISNK